MILQIATSEKNYPINLTPSQNSSSEFTITSPEDIISAIEGLFVYLKDHDINLPAVTLEKIFSSSPTLGPKSKLKKYDEKSSFKTCQIVDNKDTTPILEPIQCSPYPDPISDTNIEKSSPSFRSQNRDLFGSLTVKTNKSQISNANGYVEFECDLINGKKDGYGRWLHKNGKIKYEGQFQNDGPHGEDLIVYYQNGFIEYQGNMYEGLYNGYGKLYHYNGL